MSETYKKLEEKDSQFKTDKDLIEIQKTIIYFGKEILQKLTDIHETLKKDKSLEISKQEIEDPILRHLLQIKIPPGYKGNDLKW